MHRKSFRCSLMFRLSRILFMAPCIAILAMPLPVQAGAGDRDPSAYATLNQSRHGGFAFSRKHRDPVDRGRRYRMGLLTGQGMRNAGGVIPPDAAAAPGIAPFQPPVRFSYYCNNPPGYFPAVAGCSVP